MPIASIGYAAQAVRRRQSHVAICAERGLEMIVGLLAIVKAGGAYVPLDPGYPADRLRFLLEDSAARVLLVQGNLRSCVPDYDGAPLDGLRPKRVLDLWEGRAADWANHDVPADDRAGPSEQPPWPISYTSGSTGTPKGVMVEHGSICQVTSSMAELLFNPGRSYRPLSRTRRTSLSTQQALRGVRCVAYRAAAWCASIEMTCFRRLRLRRN